MAYKSRAKRLEEVLGNLSEQVETAKVEARDEVEALKDEITSWREGMEGTNLENTDKYSELEECESELEDVFDEIDNIEIEVGGDVNFPGMY